MNFSDEEEKEFIQKIFKKFDKKEDLNSSFIGNGHTGSVWKISDDLCVKIGKEICHTEIPESFKECENLCVPLKTFISKSGTYIGVVQRFLNLPSIQYLIKNGIKLPKKQSAKILFDILKGLKVIHENGYVHRDFYPGNIMLTKKEKNIMAVIIDFDEMRPIAPETKACFQYNGYQAPEVVFNNDVYDEKSEMFAFGITFWELVVGKCPFGGYEFFGKVIENSWDNYMQNPELYNNRVKSALNNLPNCLEKVEGVSNECTNLLRSLLDFNKDNRISAKEALEHPFFRRTLGNEYQNIKENDVNNKNVLNMLNMERD